MTEERRERNSGSPTETPAPDAPAPKDPKDHGEIEGDCKRAPTSEGDLETGETGEEEKKKNEGSLGSDQSTDADDYPDSAKMTTGATSRESKINGSSHQETRTSANPNVGSIPGAFAITPPSMNDPVVQNLQSQSNVLPSATVTLASQTQLQTNNLPSSLSYGISAEVIAFGVEINDNENSGNANRSGSKKTQNTVKGLVVAFVLGLVVLSVVLVVSLSRREALAQPLPPQKDQSPPINNDSLLKRREDMINFLGGLTAPDAFDRNHSEASADRIAALKWIVEDDGMRLPIPDSDDNISAWKLFQRYTMALLYISLNGDQWTTDFKFLSSYNVCQWSTRFQNDAGAFLNNKNLEVRGLICDAEEKVTEISLWWNNLSGTIPDEISLLSDTLRIFSVGGGSVTGTIPSSFGNFSKLETFAINDNCLTGSIPEGLYKMPSMTGLLLYNTNSQLSGSMESLCESPLGLPEEKWFIVDPSANCSCCMVCDNDQFTCYEPRSNVTGTMLNVFSQTAFDSQNNAIQFTRECNSPLQLQYINKECPCVLDYNTDPVTSYCSNCTAPGARPSYTN